MSGWLRGALGVTHRTPAIIWPPGGHTRELQPRTFWVAEWDTVAMLDSGSAITLVRPELVGEVWGEEITVACIHGDTRRYPPTVVQVITPRGCCQIRAGVVENLPVPMLMGQDCPLFQTYWLEGPRRGDRRPRAHILRTARPARPHLSWRARRRGQSPDRHTSPDPREAPEGRVGTWPPWDDTQKGDNTLRRGGTRAQFCRQPCAPVPTGPVGGSSIRLGLAKRCDIGRSDTRRGKRPAYSPF